MARCPVSVPFFCCHFVSEIYFWKYSRNWTKLYGDHFYAKTKTDTEEGHWGRPTGQGRPPAAGPGGATAGTRLWPSCGPSTPSDAYKFTLTLKTSGQPLFSRNSTPTRRQLEPEVPSEADPGTLPEGRSILEGSSSPCLPPG